MGGERKEAAMDKDTESIVEELMELTHRVRRGGRRADARAKATGGANGFVLRHLRERGESSPSALRDALNVSTPRVTAILNDLEEHGLVSRLASEADHRRVSVRLTAKGRTVVDEQLDELRDQVVGLVDRIGEDDAKALVRILRAVAEDGGTFPF